MIRTIRYSSVSFCLALLCGCQNVNELLQRQEAAASEAPATAPVPVAAKNQQDRIVPVRSDQPLVSFEVGEQPYADEAKDEGVPPVSALIDPNYHGATPTSLAGGRLITTYQLHRLLTDDNKTQPILINVLGGSATEIIPADNMDHSVWLSGAGAYGRFDDETQQRLETHLEALTGGDKKKPVVFYCLASNCWLSFNAALRATNLRYRNVHWYRGGLKSWYAAGLPTLMTREDSW